MDGEIELPVAAGVGHDLKSMSEPENSAALPRGLAQWIRLFGPGAILASLTIGVGELVFSTRAGALFGYKLLWFFAVVLFFKWLLVFSAARHMALTGAHPFERWMELPGPRGWFPLIFLLLAVASFPIWAAFHAGTIGTLAAGLTGSKAAVGGGAHFVWGLGILGAVSALTWMGGYKLLERAQVAIVAVMLAAVLVAFFMLKPDWAELLGGLLPQSVGYPPWAPSIPELRTRPVWVETITYVGVIGGSAYDYLAYVSYVREKGWVGGKDGKTLQTQFLSPLLPGLEHLYFAGAFLAVFGTLYGTIEVAPAIAREWARARKAALARDHERTIRRWSIAWVCGGGAAALAASLAHVAWGKTGTPPALIAILTPANLFTGVLACGFVCFLSVWADLKFLDRRRRMPVALMALNIVGGFFFVMLGLKSYWDYDATFAWAIFGVTVCAGWVGAILLGRKAQA